MAVNVMEMFDILVYLHKAFVIPQLQSTNDQAENWRKKKTPYNIKDVLMPSFFAKICTRALWDFFFFLFG